MENANMTNKDIKILLFLPSKLSRALQLKKEKRKLIDWEYNPLWKENKREGGREIGEFESAQSTVIVWVEIGNPPIRKLAQCSPHCRHRCLLCLLTASAQRSFVLSLISSSASTNSINSEAHSTLSLSPLIFFSFFVGLFYFIFLAFLPLIDEYMCSLELYF